MPPAREVPGPSVPAEEYVSRVLLYEPEVEEPSLRALLDTEGLEVVPCTDGERLIEDLMAHRPEVIVCVIHGGREHELAFLHLLRRVAPLIPLILVVSDGSLQFQRQIQEARPIFYALTPVDPLELRSAVRAALGRVHGMPRARPA